MTGRDIFKEGAIIDDSFVRGLMAAPSSFRTIRRLKGTLKYFIIPFLLNLIILSTIVYGAYTMAYETFFSLIQGSAWYNKLFEYLLAPLLALLLGIVIVVLYSIIGSIITAPFNDFLSQRVEEGLTGGRFNEPFNFSILLHDIFRIAGNIIKLLLIILLINSALLLLNLIPAAGSVLYTIAGFLTTCFFLGFQFFDFPLERRRFVFREKLAIAWRFKRTVAGVGASFFLMTFIPLIGFLGLNFATTGAAELFVGRIMPALRPDRDTGGRT